MKWRRATGHAPWLRVPVFTAAAFAGVQGVSGQAGLDPAFVTFKMAEGLSHNSVTALLQDSTGFLWIGTYDGLNRYDGAEFKVYRHEPHDSASLRDDFVLSLALGADGRIWIGTERGGLQGLDPLTGAIEDVPLYGLGPWGLDAPGGARGERVGRTVQQILTLSDGTLALLTDVGLVRFAPASHQATVLLHVDGGSAGVHATAIAESADGDLLTILSDGRTALLDREGQLRPLPLSLPDSASWLTRDGDGFWVATPGGGIYQIDPSLTSVREVTTLPGSSSGSTSKAVVQSALPIPDGSLWVATTAGAYHVDPIRGLATRVGGSGGGGSLANPDIQQILLDRCGLLWFATWDGLSMLHPYASAIVRIGASEAFGGAGVIKVLAERDGDAWLGTYGSGLLRLSRSEGGWRATPLRVSAPPLRRAYIFGLSRESDGTLWAATFPSGLWRIGPGGRAEEVRVSDGRGSTMDVLTYSVLVDHAGDVWAGTAPAGLVRLDTAAGHFARFGNGVPGWEPGSDFVWPLAEDSRGRLWVGAYNGGLSVISPDRAEARFVPEPPGPQRIMTLFVDGRDRVWFGTEGDGLTLVDPESGETRTWTTRDGLPHDNVAAIVEDSDGVMWIATDDGLARMDPLTETFSSLHEPTGLAGNHFFANGAHRGPDGTLYFGGRAGLTIIPRGAIEPSLVPPQVSLTAFRIRGRDVPLARAVRTTELVLQPSENFFAFDFAAMDFADPSQNRYRYRLENLDPDWVDAGTTPTANYTSVPPGRYVFHVAARNSAGVWNQDALALPIRVLAPYYRTWWFQSLVAVAVLSVIVAFYTYRLRQLEARQRLRLEIAGELHDDIGANLSNMALKADMVRAASTLDARRAAILEDVSRLARDTAHKVRETVWVVNTRYDTLPRLVGHLHDAADTLLAGHVEYRFDSGGEPPERPVSMEFRQNVYLLFKEVLNNVVKHARAEHVEIAVSATSRALSIRVADDGVGFDPDRARDGNGQELMRTRAAALGGRLSVVSAPGRGTAVELSARIR